MEEDKMYFYCIPSYYVAHEEELGPIWSMDIFVQY